MSTPVEGAFAALLEQDTRFGYLDRHILSRRAVNPRLIVNNESGTMLRALRDELRHANSFAFSVAFVTPRAVALLKQELIDFGGPGLIVTSTYLGFNSPRAFAELLGLEALGIDVRLHSDPAFHPKGYIFGYENRLTAILGSSNLTEQALVQNHEWNLRVSATRDSDLADQLDAVVAGQRRDSLPLSQQWIDAYAESYIPPSRPLTPNRLPVGTGPTLPPELPGDLLAPNAMQLEALAAITNLRDSDTTRALVISATGTGKTILAALDVRAVKPRRMLFVVHREQILDRAIEEFRRVLGAPAEEFGKLTGTSKLGHRKYVFATIQTLSQPDVLYGIEPDAFDYVLVDEVHHAGANSYRRVLDHLRPKFTLGMTATPERNDGFNVFELFDFNVPYEIRLAKALESDMLAPFHYFGVQDVTFDDGTTVTAEDRIDRLASRVRVDHVLEALDRYTQAGIAPRGLVFCSRVDEATALSDALNDSTLRGRRLRTVALSGGTPTAERERAVERLTRGELDYILTVDIFNEGVDIPAVNQVVMLRQTQSSIVFVQQLGRGLRKYEGKDYIVVIDFIGNYANNYMIPIALFGDDSLNKESLRQHLVSAEESGVLLGLSSIRFDRVSQARVLASITQARLDSLRNIKIAFDLLRNRLGRIPRLADFHRFDSADPIVVATRAGNYPALVGKFTHEATGLSAGESRMLTMMSREVFDAKRVHEGLVVRCLLEQGASTVEDVRAYLAARGVAADSAGIASALRSLMLDYYTQQEQTKYGVPLAEFAGDRVKLTEDFLRSYATSETFAVAIEDLLATGTELTSNRYGSGRPFVVGRQYSRKDACRLLGWSSNSSSTIYGYKVDKATLTCPIFVTLHKSDDVSASTAYEDELIDRQNMRWFTRNGLSLNSGEVKAILSNQVALHVFAKQSDAEGTAFYYLGRATPHEAADSTMAGTEGQSLKVVTMRLQFEDPIESAVYDYFHPVVTD